MSRAASFGSPFDLTGRRALVTGSTRGIGASIATAFARAGADVIIHGRDADRAAAAAARLRDTPPEAEISGVHSVAFDVTDYAATDLNTALVEDPEFSAWVVNRTPARRWGTPADLAGPAVWLASSASDFVNGQLIFVDGGMTAVI